MPVLRLLSASLLSSAFVIHATAQSPATSFTRTTQPVIVTFGTPQSTPSPLAVIPKPAPSTFSLELPQSTSEPSMPAAPQSTLPKTSITQKLKIDARPLDPQAEAKALALLAKQESRIEQVNPPCYAMRSYSFTAQDLRSPNPRPSSETVCAPASSIKLKSAHITTSLIKVK